MKIDGWNMSDRSRQIVAKLLGQGCEMAIIEDEPQVILDDAQPLRRPIRGGIV